MGGPHRRDLLRAGGAAALLSGMPRLARAVPSKAREVAGAALTAARAAGASYADVRLERIRRERIDTRDEHLVRVSSGESFGLGVRVLVKGSWGFAATQDVTSAGGIAAATRAAGIARASVRLQRSPVSLYPAPPVRDTWQTPLIKDPFRVGVERKIQLLFDVARAARAPGVPVVAVEGWMESVSQEKQLFSSEGAEIDQTLIRVGPGYRITVGAKGDFETRTHPAAPLGGGFEQVEGAGLVEDAPRLAGEALEKMKADPVAPGELDLVLLPSALWLVLRESLGHTPELDRMMGYEANLAGTSFLTPADAGSLRIGPELMNLSGDRTTPLGLATCGYDDDGLKADRFELIREGVLVDLETAREEAGWPGAVRAHPLSYAHSWECQALPRLPNLSLAPAPSGTTVEGLISAVADGILVEGVGAGSIDQQGYSFQFSGDSFRRIRDGKVGDPLRYLAYQSTTPTFWSRLDGLGGAETWALGGTLGDAKGEPIQPAPVSVGAPAARFRGITVLDSRATHGAERIR